MIYTSLPISFIHSKSIVMHPPKVLQLMGESVGGRASLIRKEITGSAEKLYVQEPAANPGSFRVSSRKNQPALLPATVTEEVRYGSEEIILYMQPAFSDGGQLQYSLYDTAGRPMLCSDALLQFGTEQQTIRITMLRAGQYNLQVTWMQDGQATAAVYKVQKLH